MVLGVELSRVHAKQEFYPLAVSLAQKLNTFTEIIKFRAFIKQKTHVNMLRFINNSPVTFALENEVALPFSTVPPYPAN